MDNPINAYRRSAAKLLSTALVVLAALLVTACTSGSAGDARTLLGSVPSDADMVAVVNVEKILKKAGCKVEGTRIVPSDKIQNIIDSLNNKSKQAEVEFFLNDASGINPATLVIFSASRTVLTGLIEDPAKFKEYWEKAEGKPFEEKDGINVLKNVAYTANQFWVGMPLLPDSETLARYTKLSENQSILSRGYSDKLASLDRDMRGVADIQAALSTQGRIRTQASMLLATLFDGAASVEFYGDIKENSMDLTALMLDADNKPAKFLLPTSVIDTKVVNMLKGNAEVVMAGAVSSDLVKQLASLIGSFGGGLPAEYTDALMELNGTMAFAVSSGGNSGIITTKGKPSAALTELAGSLSGDVVTVEDKYLMLNKGGALEGQINIADMAPLFKGAMFGMAGDFESQGSFGSHTLRKNPPIQSVMLVPQNNTLAIRVNWGLGQNGWRKIISSF